MPVPSMAEKHSYLDNPSTSPFRGISRLRKSSYNFGAPRSGADLRELPGKRRGSAPRPQVLIPAHINCVFMGKYSPGKTHSSDLSTHQRSPAPPRRGRGRGPTDVSRGWTEKFRGDRKTRGMEAFVSLTRLASVSPWVQDAQGLRTPGNGASIPHRGRWRGHC